VLRQEERKVSEVVADLERRFLARLAEAGAGIERDFPHVRAKPWSAPLGSLTAAQGQVIGLECWLSDAPLGGPDSVGLEISVWHLTTIPELYDAYVAWSEGGIELEALASPVPYSPAAVGPLESQVGSLVAALREAVARGKPRV
jgi:hypothetical protein